MIESVTLTAILDSIDDPILFAGTDHVVCYMNKAAIAHYTGGETLLGSSLLDCHNERSCEIIVEVLAALEAGEDERLISEDSKRRIYMRAVRDTSGAVIGYYERYAAPATQED